MRRWLLRILIPVLALAFLSVVFGEGYRLYRQSVVRSWTRINPEVGLESLERLALGGVEQWILVRGQNPKNPLLLWLQGGPGLPVFPWVRLMGVESGIEYDFTVVYWEQRGTGKSADAASDPSAIKMQKYIADVCELGEMLRKQFDSPKVVLAAHSWGTVIGVGAVQKCPELFSAYVGINSLVNTVEQDRQSTEFIRRQAQQSNDRDALQALTAIGTPPFSIDTKIQQRALLGKYLGLDARGPRTSWRMFKDTVQTPEYRLSELIWMFMDPYRVQKLLVQEMNQLNLLAVPITIKTPVYIVHGRKDMLVPAALAEQFYQHIEAPAGKELIWFEESAHMAPLEQPEELRKVMRKVKSGQIGPPPSPEKTLPRKGGANKKAQAKAQP